MAIHISTINVRSVKSEVRRDMILTNLKSFKADVFLIQECGIPFLNDYRTWVDAWPHRSLWSGSNENRNDGVAILLNNPAIQVKGSTVVRDGRALLVNLSFYGKSFNLLNIYGYNTKQDRDDLLSELRPHLRGRVPLVVGGDFNTILNYKDRRGAAETHKLDKTSMTLKNL